MGIYSRRPARPIAETWWYDRFRALGGTNTILVIYGTAPTVVDTRSVNLQLVYTKCKTGDYGNPVPDASHPVTIWLPPGVSRLKSFEGMYFDIEYSALSVTTVSGVTYTASTSRLSKTGLGDTVGALLVDAGISAIQAGGLQYYSAIQTIIDLDSDWIEISPGMGTSDQSNVLVRACNRPVLPNLDMDTAHLHIIGCGPQLTEIRGLSMSCVILRSADDTLLAGLTVTNDVQNSNDAESLGIVRGAICDGFVGRTELEQPGAVKCLSFDVRPNYPRYIGILGSHANYAIVRSTLVRCCSFAIDGPSIGNWSDGAIIDCVSSGAVAASAHRGSGLSMYWNGLALGSRFESLRVIGIGRAINQCGSQRSDLTATFLGCQFYSDSGPLIGDQAYASTKFIDCAGLTPSGDFVGMIQSLVPGPFYIDWENGTWSGNCSTPLIEGGGTSYLRHRVYGSPSFTNNGSGGIWENTPSYETGSCPIPSYDLLPGVADEIDVFRARNERANHRAAHRIVNRWLADHLLDSWLEIPPW